MPIPLTGHQRHILAAMIHLRKGKSRREVADAIKRSFSYLEPREIVEFIKDAKRAINLADRAAVAKDDEPLSKYRLQ